MYAIEFQAQAQNGIVQIPAQYATWKNKRVKVILLEPDNEQPVEKLQFKAVKLSTKAFRFNRDEVERHG